MGARVDGSLPLAGCRVLVTRPVTQAANLIAMLRAAGADAIAAPLLMIEPVSVTATARSVIQNLDHFDIVIVTSRHAAESGVDMLAGTWPQWPAPQTWLAVGPGTADALRQKGIAAQFPDDARSEGLLAMSALVHAQARRILLLTGEGGRELLENALQERGAVVTRLATYRRVVDPVGAEVLRTLRDKFVVSAPGAAPCVLVTSVEAIQNLVRLAPWIVDVQVSLIVAGARIAAAARDNGFLRIVDARTAGDDAMVSALVIEYSRGKHA